MSGLGRLWRNHRALLLAFAAAALLTLFFAGRMLFFAIYWSNPAHRNQSLQGWMTLGYVARSWGVPVETLDAALGLGRTAKRRSTLDEIAAEQGVAPEDLRERLAAVLAEPAKGPGK